MSTSGTINVALTANTTEFTNKIRLATKDLEKFSAADIGKGALKGLGFNPAQITAVATGFTAIAEGAEIAVEAATKFVEIGAEVVSTLAEWVMESAEVIDASNKMAGALGISVESFMGLGAAAAKEADTNAEAFTSMMLKMEKSIGSSSAQDDLKKLGLSTAELSKIPADQQFLKIADAISKLESPIDQVTAATSLFGKEGGKLLPLINQGAEAIEELRDKAVKYGVAVSTMDAGKIGVMKDQLEEVGMQWTGIKNTITIAIAPALLRAAQLVSSLIPPAQELAFIFEKWINNIAIFVDAFSDVVRIGEALRGGHVLTIADILSNPGNDAQAWVTKAKKEMETALAGFKLPKLAPTIDEDGIKKIGEFRTALASLKLEAFTQNMDAANKRLFEFFAKWSSIADARGMADAFLTLNRIAAEAQQGKINDFLKDLRFEAATANLKGINLLVAQMKDKFHGISDEAIQIAIGLQNIKDKAKENADWATKIEQAYKDAQTPLDQYKSRLAEINEMVAHGLGLEAARNLKLKATQDLLTATRAAAEPGITDARTTRFNLLPALPSRRDPAADIAAALRSQGVVEKQQLEQAKRIEQAVRDNGLDVVTIDEIGS